MENRDFGHSDAVLIHVGTYDVRRSRNLEFIMGEVCDLVNQAKAKFSGYRLELSSVLRSKGVIWRLVRAANDILELVAGSLGATFVDPNSWIRDLDLSSDGLYLNRNGARKLGDLYPRVCGIDGGSRKVLNNWQNMVGSEFTGETSEGSRKKADRKHSTSGQDAVEAG